jgi:hypothetical protein
LIDDDAVDDDAVDDDTVDDDTVDDDTVDDDTVDDDTVDDDSIDDDTTPIDCNAVITRQPYLQSVTQTGITVMWGTDIPGDSTVEYGLTDALGQTVYLADQQIVHLVELTGLEPQTTYYYKATSCHDETTVASFRTAPLRDTPFNFTAFSDNHCHAEIFGPFVDMMIGFDPDFAISVGDTVDDGRDPTQYDPCFFTPAQELFRSAPVYVAFGNHEHFSLTY